MNVFKTLQGRAAHLDMQNVDTDQVIPARFLRNPRSTGYAGFLFHDLRIAPDGSPYPEFALNRPENAGASILIAGANFGCGSSREGAVYALSDAGIRCVIAPSFGDIFSNNCYKNGVLPVSLSRDAIDTLLAAQGAGASLCVDLPSQTVTAGPVRHPFAIEPFWKECLLEGIDDIDLTLRERDKIAAFASKHLAAYPWLALDMHAWAEKRPAA